jgi:hypothetical protein
MHYWTRNALPFSSVTSIRNIFHSLNICRVTLGMRTQSQQLPRYVRRSLTQAFMLRIHRACPMWTETNPPAFSNTSFHSQLFQLLHECRRTDSSVNRHFARMQTCLKQHKKVPRFLPLHQAMKNNVEYSRVQSNLSNKWRSTTNYML